MTRVVILILISVLSATTGGALLLVSVVVQTPNLSPFAFPTAIAGGALIVSGSVMGAAAFLADLAQCNINTLRSKASTSARQHDEKSGD